MLAIPTKLFINEMYANIAGTLLNALIIILIYALLYILFVKKIDNAKTKKKTNARFLYVLILIFIIISAKTWLEGFTQLLAIFSLISAGFVIANKELVMNLMGWLIINWRSVFTEGDYIEIHELKGYVHDVKLLYFELLEVSECAIAQSSGRLIKIPNHFVTIYPIVNHNMTNHFIEYSISWNIPRNIDIETAKNLIIRIAKANLANYYQNVPEFSIEALKKKHKLLAKLLDLDVHVSYVIPKCICEREILTLYYFCFPKDEIYIHENLKIQISKQIRELSELKLAKQRDQEQS